MKISLNKSTDVDTFAKRMFYLAWQACGGPLGMGIFQNRPAATEDEVYKNVLTAGDYPGCHNRLGEVYGDYVFGRMMKFGFSFENDILEFHNTEFRPDYQGFARKYPNLESLIDATCKSLGVEVEVVG